MLDLTQPKHAHIEQRLRNEIMAWLGTVRSDGRPHLVPVWFLWDGSTILIFSQPNQKIKNIQHNANVTFAIDDTKGGGDVVLVEGKAELLAGDVQLTNLNAYLEKYGSHIKELGWTPESMAKDYSQAIRITPTKFISW